MCGGFMYASSHHTQVQKVPNSFLAVAGFFLQKNVVMRISQGWLLVNLCELTKSGLEALSGFELR